MAARAKVEEVIVKFHLDGVSHTAKVTSSEAEIKKWVEKAEKAAAHPRPLTVGMDVHFTSEILTISLCVQDGDYLVVQISQAVPESLKHFLQNPNVRCIQFEHKARKNTEEKLQCRGASFANSLGFAIPEDSTESKVWKREAGTGIGMDAESVLNPGQSFDWCNGDPKISQVAFTTYKAIFALKMGLNKE